MRLVLSKDGSSPEGVSISTTEVASDKSVPDLAYYSGPGGRTLDTIKSIDSQQSHRYPPSQSTVVPSDDGTWTTYVGPVTLDAAAHTIQHRARDAAGNWGVEGTTRLDAVPTGPAAAPVVTSPPVISGTMRLGQVLTATAGTWDSDEVTTSVQGKGYYVQARASTKLKILMIFNKLSSYKKEIYSLVISLN